MLSTALTRVLLNGSPGQAIWHAHELQQGDPLSSMLFVIAMDLFNNLLAEADSLSLLEPIGGPCNIPHSLSLYVDNATLFLTLMITNLQATKAILQVFGEASGLHTNHSKNSISSICCTDQHSI